MGIVDRSQCWTVIIYVVVQTNAKRQPLECADGFGDGPRYSLPPSSRLNHLIPYFPSHLCARAISYSDFWPWKSITRTNDLNDPRLSFRCPASQRRPLPAMQFALPPRRSPAPPYAHSSRFPRYRRKQLKTVAVLAIAVFTILYLLPRLFSSSSPSVVAPAGTASVVIVTVIDREQLSESYIKKIVENREDYAKRHGKSLPSLP